MRCRRSARLTPAAATRTVISPSQACGSGTSATWSTSGPPGASATIARMGGRRSRARAALGDLAGQGRGRYRACPDRAESAGVGERGERYLPVALTVGVSGVVAGVHDLYHVTGDAEVVIGDGARGAEVDAAVRNVGVALRADRPGSRVDEVAAARDRGVVVHGIAVVLGSPGNARRRSAECRARLHHHHRGLVEHDER